MQSIAVEPKPTTSEPTNVSTAVNYTVPSSANYLVLVTGTVADVVVTVSSLRSHRIVNAGANRIIVDSTTAPNVSLLAGQAVDVMWDTAGSQHRTFLINSSTALSPVGSTYASITNTLVAGDAGKPLSRGSVLNDTSSTSWFSHLLVAVISSSVLHVAGRGVVASVPIDLLDGGTGYNAATSGYFLYWDASAVKYKAEKQADADAQIGAVLELLSIGTTTFDARVL